MRDQKLGHVQVELPGRPPIHDESLIVLVRLERRALHEIYQDDLLRVASVVHLDDSAAGLDGLGSLVGVELRSLVSHVVEASREPELEESASQHVGGVVAVDGRDVSLARDLAGDGLEALEGGGPAVVRDGVDSAAHLGAGELGVVGSASVDALEDSGGLDGDELAGGEGVFLDDGGLPAAGLEGGDDVLGGKRRGGRGGGRRALLAAEELREKAEVDVEAHGCDSFRHDELKLWHPCVG